MSPSSPQNANIGIVQPNRWYLAYGSNLSSKTFRGWRGIRPLAQTNVVVPSLELTFDLPGVPYWEPCFANVRRRQEPHASMKSHPVLIGVAYLVTDQDFARIIATEGGGQSYQEAVVECRRLPNRNDQAGGPNAEVEANAETPGQNDQGELILASTLLAPDSKRWPSPLQPSKRYINIIRAGAREHGLPASYIAYLDDIRHYRTKNLWQQVGAYLFFVMWLPPVAIIFSLRTVAADPDTGRLPKWMGDLTGAMSSAMWQIYGRVWKTIFGNGEVTEGGSASSAGHSGYGEEREKSQGAPTAASSAHIDGLYHP